MDVGTALQIQRRAIEAWIRVMANGSPGAKAIELDGVSAVVVPACPERSLVNCAVYRDAEALAAALPELADAYEAAGVRAWTVWVPDNDREAIALLGEAGHQFDGEPAAMHLDLADLRPAQADGLDWDAEADPAEIGHVNDIAYGYEPGQGPGKAIGLPPAGIRADFYRARVDGRVACVLETIDAEDDCFITFVATLPEYRGRALATTLLGEALREARNRGLRTSSLQSSMLGRGIYERLGYEMACRLQLHERRL